MYSKGVVYVAFGALAVKEAKLSSASLFKHNKISAKIFRDFPVSNERQLSTDQLAHWAKVSMYWLTPFDHTLMLDADTRIHASLEIGFKMLQDGWELVMVPSKPADSGEVLWHLSVEDKQYTIQQVGALSGLMFNTGVMFFRKTPRTRELFSAWQDEWSLFKDRDQGAFLRALHKCPVKLFLLGYPYNSANGEVVEHLFGRACAK